MMCSAYEGMLSKPNSSPIRLARVNNQVKKFLAQDTDTQYGIHYSLDDSNARSLFTFIIIQVFRVSKNRCVSVVKNYHPYLGIYNRCCFSVGGCGLWVGFCYLRPTSYSHVLGRCAANTRPRTEPRNIHQTQ